MRCCCNSQPVIQRFWERCPPCSVSLIPHSCSMSKLSSNETPSCSCSFSLSLLNILTPQVSREELWRVDVSYVEAFADICKTAGVHHFILLSAVGADPNSSAYLLRVKAAAEAGMRKHHFIRISIFRPSTLLASKTSTAMSRLQVLCDCGA